MRNVYEVLRQKEAQAAQIQKEIASLVMATRLLTDDETPEQKAVAAPLYMPASQPSLVHDTSSPDPAPKPVGIRERSTGNGSKASHR